MTELEYKTQRREGIYAVLVCERAPNLETSTIEQILNRCAGANLAKLAIEWRDEPGSTLSLEQLQNDIARDRLRD
jgi:hypothetical protein